MTFFGLISLPINMFTLSAIQQRRKVPYTLKPKNSEWEELSTYARFPMGMPPGVDLGALQPAPD